MRIWSIKPGRFATLPGSLLTAAFSSAGSPFKLTLAPTYRCSYKCYYCGLWSRCSPELDSATLVDAIAPMKSLTWLDITGGEIFARPDIEQLCLALVDSLPRLALFHFPTSGSHPRAAIRLASALAASGVKVVVSVSLEGPRALHDAVRGAPGAYDKAVETFRGLAELPGVDVYTGTTMIRENVDLVPQDVHKALSQDIPELTPERMHFNVMQGSTHYFCNAGARRPSNAQVSAALRRIILWKGLPKSPFDCLELGFRSVALAALAGRHNLVPTCTALRSSLFIAPDGTVFPCHIWGEPVGRIGPTASLQDLHTSDRWKWLRTQVASQNCPTCWTPCEAYPTMLTHLLHPLPLSYVGGL